MPTIKSNQRQTQVSNLKSKINTLPVAQQRQHATPAPRIRYRNDGPSTKCIINHREYLRDILGSVAFAVTAFSVNPGLPGSFPWLSAIASNFEKYSFRKLRFLFETMRATTADGTVLQAIDYDAADAAPVNKTAMMSYSGAMRSAPWAESEIHARQLDLQRLKQFYVRTGNLPANQDIKTYDVGTYFIGTVGMSGPETVGELYVEYEVELMTPQLDFAVQAFAVSGRATASTGVTRAAPLGTSPALAGGLPFSALSDTITFNRVGEYILAYQFVGTTATNTLPTLTGTASSTAISTFQGYNAALTGGQAVYKVQVNAVGATVIFNFTSSCATMTSSIFSIGEFSYTF
jgi:hypothetical protein